MTFAGLAMAPAARRTSPREDHQQPFRQAPARLCRRVMYQLADALAPISRKRVALCGRRRVAGHVALCTYPDANAAPHAHYRGLMRCGSVWECPCCRLQICAHRAAEIQRVVDAHHAAYGNDSVLLLTPTIRHGIEDDLRTLRAGVAEAWTRTLQGRWWQKLNERLGIVTTYRHAGKIVSKPKIGIIRALETTRGQCGWHVHIHALLFLRRALSDEELRALHLQLDDRWRKRVVSVLGPEHAPDHAHGVDLRPLRCCPDYLAKFGLELADPGTKSAKRGNRTPLQIAYDFATQQRTEDAVLWQAYCTGVRGARMITWSHGLRAHYGLQEALEDREVIASAEDQGSTLVGLIPASIWTALRVVPQARVRVLEAAERGGAPEVERVMRSLLGSKIPHHVRVFLLPDEVQSGFG